MAYNTTTDRILDRSKTGIEESLGRCGGQLLGITATTGNFRALQFIADASITTVGSLELSNIAITTGTVLYGDFTSVTSDTANAVIAYNACK